MSNITQVVNSDKNMTTFKQGIAAAGLNQVLSGRGPFTVFAPSDTAFEKLDAGILQDLLKPENKLQLTSLLNQHVTSGKINYNELKDGDIIQTLAGNDLTVEVKDGKVFINGALVQSRTGSPSNGVVLSLDTVLTN